MSAIDVVHVRCCMTHTHTDTRPEARRCRRRPSAPSHKRPQSPATRHTRKVRLVGSPFASAIPAIRHPRSRPCLRPFFGPARACWLLLCLPGVVGRKGGLWFSSSRVFLGFSWFRRPFPSAFWCVDGCGYFWVLLGFSCGSRTTRKPEKTGGNLRKTTRKPKKEP